MWVDDYQWHYDYIRLAWDTGFSFEKCKNPNMDKNQIGITDIDRIVKERDVGAVDRYISTVVQYVLEDEQAKVLDFNFVKIFRLCQLAVEYLLFCKKYLDNTVVLLKKELSKNRDENKELKSSICELESYLESISKHQALSTYKCNGCSKAFSSQEYLNSHVKRRHDNENIQTYNAETDKLNTEIKELKERLNAAEKLLKEKNEQIPEKSILVNDNNSSKMTELWDKFEQFKHKVDTELNDLKSQRSFYEQNYGKLFEMVFQNKENVEPKNSMRDILKSETAIQTDKLLNIESVINKNILEIHESGSDSDKASENKAVNVELIKDAIQSKMTSSLAGIENQMQAFWEKLVQIEQNKTKIEEPVIIENNIGDTYDIKPRVKPRSKLTNTVQPNNNDKVKLRQALEDLEQKEEEQKVELHNRNEAVVAEPINQLRVERQLEKGYSLKQSSENESSEHETDSDQTSSDDQQVQKREEFLESHKGQEERVETGFKSVAKSVKTKKTTKSLLVTEKNIQRDVSAKKCPLPTLSEITKSVESTIAERLQELGISHNWRRLPIRSVEKALEIINHQAFLSKKSYPNFDKIKKKIQSDIDKQITKKSMNKTQLEVQVHTPSPKTKKLQNIVRVSYRPKSSKRSTSEQRAPDITSPKHTIPEIKNRYLYDTDTESDQHLEANQKNVSSKSEILPIYSQVVQDFKNSRYLEPDVKPNFIDMDSSDVEKRPKPSPRNGQKGVLKNYPSVNSLSKKKVFFDLESESNKVEDVPMLQKTGGSTTSIASSILGEKIYSPRSDDKSVKKEEKHVVEKDLEELSDFDFSELH